MKVIALRTFSNPPHQPGDRFDVADYQRALQLIEQRYVIKYDPMSSSDEGEETLSSSDEGEKTSGGESLPQEKQRGKKGA